MKKTFKFATVLAILASLFMIGCSNLSDDATVSGGIKNVDNTKTLTINVTSSSNLVNFAVSSNPSRTILPTAETVDKLWFYLCAKNNTKGDADYAAPVVVEVIPTDEDGVEDKSLTDAKTGHVVINLTKADYDFELFAVKKGASETTAPSYTSEALVRQKAVLVGKANADIRGDDPVNFYLTTDGLTTEGNVALKLYADGWDPSADTYKDYKVSAVMTYTKTITGHTAGAALDGSDKDVTPFTNAAPTTANYAVTAACGTYDFSVNFTKGGTNDPVYTWNDRIIVLPGQATEATIPLPLVIETPPDAPESFNAGYIDTTNPNSNYYTVEFVWDAEDIINESHFELELMEMPSSVADTNSVQPTTDAEWDSRKAHSEGANGVSTVCGTDFYGNLETWLDGSLQKNNQMAQFKLALGKRYVARIRAVNAAGESDWVYAKIDEAIDADADAGVVAAKAFTSSTINRYRVSYDLAGGTLTPADTETIYYYCQKFGTTTDGVVTDGGNPVMQPDGDHDFDAKASHLDKTVTKPTLKTDARTWTNWLKDTKEYNKVGVAPNNYVGCENLTLVANYAVIGSITIFDDSAYAIPVAEITSNVELKKTDTFAPSVTISQTDTTNEKLEWTLKYPEDVVYDNVTLVLTSTDGKRSYNLGNISSEKKFVIAVREMLTGVYRAELKAYTSVKPDDPYTATIIVTITD